MGKNSVIIFGYGVDKVKDKDSLINNTDNTLTICDKHHNKDERFKDILLKNRKPNDK